MTNVSARPALLATFDRSASSRVQTLTSSRDTHRRAFDVFVGAPGGHCASSGVPIVGIWFDRLMDEFQEIADWTKLVHDAVL
ncbi:hypothetical protein BH24ACT5_BH24ACT5_13830 [soil metagenome]